ncbi:MAG: hypothetical protein ACRDHO_14660 [Actinomycetota bacterium]
MDRLKSHSESCSPPARRLAAVLVALFLLSSAIVVHGSRPAEAASSIAFRGVSSAANAGRATLTVWRPHGVQAGDVMIASIVYRRWPRVTAPPGWTRFRRNPHANLYYRVATDTEPDSYTWRFSPRRRAVGVIVAYSGVDTTAPIDVSSGRWSKIRSKSITAPSVRTSVSGTRVIGVFGMLVRTNITRPRGMTQRAEVNAGGRTDISVLVSDMPRGNPGSTGRKRVATARAARSVGQLVALTPVGPPPPPPPPPGSDFYVQAIDSSRAALTWAAPSGTARIQVFRNGRLLDQFVAGNRNTYTDHLLWPQTTYTYRAKFFDAASNLLADFSDPLTTPPLSGSFPRLYADSSFWNQRIGSNPAIDPNSGAMVSKALVKYDDTANFTNSDAWGYPIAFADPNSKLYHVGCSRYDCHKSVSIRIPRYAKANTGSDHHLVVVDHSTAAEVDMWLGAYDSSRDTWSAGSRYATEADGWGAMCYQYQRCNGAVAAGFAEPGGVVRPEEIAQGHIDHALVIATPYTRAEFIACPATHTDGKYSDSAALPEGARIQLDPNFNVNAQPWAGWQKVIARALQTYGAYVADTSGSLEVRAEANLNRGYDAWAKVGVSDDSPSLSFLPWAKFRVLKLISC